MPRARTIRLAMFAAAGIAVLLALPCPALSQAGAGYGNMTVTLYYYDPESRTMGAIVEMPDNPQSVSADPALAAPGMYAFSQVPSGRWYYLEADDEGNKWYTIFYMDEGAGTKTANVHIPPMQPVGATPTPGPSATPEPETRGSPEPEADGTPQAAPGMTAPCAFMAAAALGVALGKLRGRRKGLLHPIL